MNIQFKKGVLDMCVLAMLREKDGYGYDIADSLSNRIKLADGTVYPILRKLAADGLVSTYLMESQNGPPRKYYHLTEDGKNKLEEYINDCEEFNKVVKGIIGGKDIE